MLLPLLHSLTTLKHCRPCEAAMLLRHISSRHLGVQPTRGGDDEALPPVMERRQTVLYDQEGAKQKFLAR